MNLRSLLAPPAIFTAVLFSVAAASAETAAPDLAAFAPVSIEPLPSKPEKTEQPPAPSVDSIKLPPVIYPKRSAARTTPQNSRDENTPRK